MKFLKLNQKGITHILAPIAFIGVFAAIGGVYIYTSHAQTPPTFLWGHTYVKGVDRAGVRITITNTHTGAKGATVSAGTLPSYRFNSIVVGYTYKLQASICINHTKYLSNNVSVPAKYNNGDGNYHDFYLTNTKSC